MAAVSDYIEELNNNVPVPVLDKILLCIGAVPVAYVTNPPVMEAVSRSARIRKKSGGK